jgi:hypothetical protein
MNIFLNVVTHIIILFGILGMLGFIIKMIVSGENPLEKIIRIFALVVGFLLYFITRAVGISVPQVIVNSLAGITPLSFGIVGMLVPLVVGVLVAWYCLDAMGRQSNLPGRVVILISTFILTLFTDIYVAVIKVPSRNQIDTNLLPNLTFVIGLLLFVVFNVKKKKTAEDS